MKKTVLLLTAIVFAFAFGCEKDGNGGWNGKYDPDKMISLNVSNITKSDNPEHLTPLEIVQQATQVEFWNYEYDPSQSWGRRFADNQRDFNTPKLMMYGKDVIRTDNYTGDTILNPYFLPATDIVITRNKLVLPEWDVDTIAYMPNRIIRDIELRIEAAFAEKDLVKCYEIFDTEYLFTPITGAEWRELKKNNQQ